MTLGINSQSTLKQRNGQIELLRILCAVVIVFNHSELLFPGGNRAVEFFFLVSGYLMMRSVSRMPSAEKMSLMQLFRDTQTFVFHKIKAFYVELLLALAIGVVFYALVPHGSCVFYVQNVLKTFFSDALLLKETGIVGLGDAVNGPVWYLSSMVLGLLFLYPLVRKIGVSLTLFALCSCVIGYCYLTTKVLPNPYALVGFTLKGNLRAFAELGLGACSYPLAERLAAVRLKTWVRCLLSAVKWGSLALLFALMYRADSSMDFLFVYLTWGVLIVIFSRQDADSMLYQGPVFLWLGRFSLPLYLSHRYYTLHLRKLLPPTTSDAVFLCILFAVSVGTALVVMYGAAYLRRLGEAGVYKRLLLAEPHQGSER